ncbi:hypothetical protein H7J07_05615 [Mycobacterium koreense]|uniref:hypothetical protein n=1 Tax=Mycolicibacillus koreensis TaxID=1069220 RepID=UPI00138D31F9|nr:hypothetical protein [Mycolicibacillus koreensis]MCV7247702.1 hypothetical protein [Mycolicibacillus koreensis]BBY54087.1 hypothetical protein MKOR_13380 [Mycolicibacillus koreensis]
MATITINVPADRITEYLDLVRAQVDDGCLSGHVDRDTHWDIDFDSGETADDLR